MTYVLLHTTVLLVITCYPMFIKYKHWPCEARERCERTQWRLRRMFAPRDDIPMFLCKQNFTSGLDINKRSVWNVAF